LTYGLKSDDLSYRVLVLLIALLRADLDKSISEAMVSPRIDHAFDRAARSYDTTAMIQVQVAKRLVATAPVSTPRSILDIGCGTGFVLTQAAVRWPQAELTGLDNAPAMLSEAKRKITRLAIVRADAGACDLAQRFDLIFSSMMLHWLAQPADVLRRWQRWLTPQGVLCVAVPVAGSLGAWRDLCDEAGVGHGLWSFPPPDFANDFAGGRVLRHHAMSYDSVLEFLRALKRSGGSTPRHDHTPISSPEMRKLVRKARRPFSISYCILYTHVRRPAIDPD